MKRVAMFLIMAAASAGCSQKQFKRDAEIVGEDALVGAAWVASVLNEASSSPGP